jgi:hypothetical protein
MKNMKKLQALDSLNFIVVLNWVQHSFCSGTILSCPHDLGNAYPPNSLPFEVKFVTYSRIEPLFLTAFHLPLSFAVTGVFPARR